MKQEMTHLTEWLRERGQTLTWLAKKLGMPLCTMSLKASGHRPWKLVEAQIALRWLKSLDESASFDTLLPKRGGR